MRNYSGEIFWEKEIDVLKHKTSLASSADHRQRLKDIKKAQRRGEISKDGSIVTLEDSARPIGISWHWQANRAVVALVREGGAAACGRERVEGGDGYGDRDKDVDRHADSDAKA